MRGERISVVVPVRDGERYLGEAIGSVLAGTRTPDEVIVVDDGSADGSAAIAEAIGEPARVLRQPPSGISAAVNAGIAAASGNLIGFIDADDLWTADKLELQVEALAADAALDAVFGLVREFLSPDLSADERDGLVLRPGDHPMRLRGTMLARREILERAGPLDEGFRVGEFVDWHSRAEAVGMRSAGLELLVLYRRLHGANHGRRAQASRIDYVRVARAALERRRLAES